MSEEEKIFLKNAELKAFDGEHRKIIKFNISRYDAAVPKGKMQYSNIELAKQRTAHLKHKAIENLDQVLIEFERNFTNKGGKVIWAQDEKEAILQIISIANRCNAKKVVKSKSMITEELELNHFLEKENIESLETDLGEYIVQLAGEKPYHIITPVMHKSKEMIAALFAEKFNLSKDSTPQEITAFVRKLLREKFISADIGITGGNFIVADIGAIALTENEGNALMSVSFPKVHIVIVGIDKVIPSLKDLDLIWPLLSTHGTGQKITVYNTLISGPKQDKEKDGPEEMYVVLLDNQRTNILNQEKQRRALNCIRCGACLNGCPVYKNIGGHTYSTTYSGPIGSVITPHLKGINEYKHLSFASSLCGKCTEVCPSKINLHELLLYNRNHAVKNGYSKRSERITMFLWKRVMLNRRMIDLVNANTKNRVLNLVFKKHWGFRRALPIVKKSSFRQLWNERSDKRK
jgi:L-lactate dehydrogenase complex protein LldF